MVRFSQGGDAIPVRLWAVAPGADEGNMELDKKNSYTADSEVSKRASEHPPINLSADLSRELRPDKSIN